MPRRNRYLSIHHRHPYTVAVLVLKRAHIRRQFRCIGFPRRQRNVHRGVKFAQVAQADAEFRRVIRITKFFFAVVRLYRRRVQRRYRDRRLVTRVSALVSNGARFLTISDGQTCVVCYRICQVDVEVLDTFVSGVDRWIYPQIHKRGTCRNRDLAIGRHVNPGGTVEVLECAYVFRQFHRIGLTRSDANRHHGSKRTRVTEVYAVVR